MFRFHAQKNFVKLVERNSFLKRDNLDLVPLDCSRELNLNKVFIIVLSKSVCHAVLYFKEHVTSWTVSIGDTCSLPFLSIISTFQCTDCNQNFGLQSAGWDWIRSQFVNFNTSSSFKSLREELFDKEMQKATSVASAIFSYYFLAFCIRCILMSPRI